MSFRKDGQGSVLQSFQEELTSAHDLAVVVMILSTADSDACCAKYGTSVIDLMQPFGLIEDTSMYVQTTGEPYRLRSFSMRFERADAIAETATADAEPRMMQLLERFAEHRTNDDASLAPWLSGFREALAASLRYAEHNGHDYPVACLHVAAAAQAQPVSAINALAESTELPAVLRDGLADPSLARAYLLINDLQDDASMQRAEQGLRELRASFGSQVCHVLSVGDPNGAPPPVASYVAGPLAKCITAHMQGRVAQLAATVREKRQGLKNTLRSWLGGKKAAADGGGGVVLPPKDGGVPRYAHSSIEAFLRQIADFAFLLRDPGIALGYYREAAAEFKRDKAWLHYACAQEMIALCLCACEAKRADVDEALDKASVYYIRASSSPGDLAARFATRVALFQHARLRRQPTKLRTREVADALVQQSTHETNLLAALLLEQAARTFVSFRGAPMTRKFAFYLILAGYRYVSCGQRKHAVRAYRAALREYEGRGWTHIEDHVHFSLARNCAQLGMIEQSLQHFVRLLGHSRQPPERQQTFAKELFSLLRLHPRDAPLPDLTLPKFDNKSIRVILNDHMQRSSFEPSQVMCGEHVLWKALVKPLLPPAEANNSNWLTRTALPTHPTAPAPCVLGEWVFVEISLRNPSHVALELSALQLQCTHVPAEPPTTEASSNAPVGASSALVEASSALVEASSALVEASSALVEASSALVEADKARVDAEAFELDAHELSLAAGKRSLLQLGVRPMREGELRITGVTWLLQNMVRGEHALELHGRRLNATKAQRMGKVYEFHQSLVMPVIPAMPLLQVSVELMPDSMLLGEVRCAKLVLRNSGAALTSLRMRQSHPAFCFVGEAYEGEGGATLAPQSAATAPAQPSQLLLHRGSAARSQETDFSTHHIQLPGGMLQPGQTIRLPLWVRAAELGTHSLHFIFCYESLTPSPKMKRRLTPLSPTLTVKPSLEVRHFLRPAHAREDGYILGLGLVNRSQTESVRVEQLSCVSSHWQLSPLCPDEQRPLIVSPGDSCSLHLRLRRALLGDETNGAHECAHAHSRAASVSSADAGARAAHTHARAAGARSAAAADAVLPHKPPNAVHSQLCFGANAVDSRKAPVYDFLMRGDARAVTAEDADATSRYGAHSMRTRRAAHAAAQNALAEERVSLLLHWTCARHSAQPYARASDAALVAADSAGAQLGAGAPSGQLQLLHLSPRVRLLDEAKRGAGAQSRAQRVAEKSRAAAEAEAGEAAESPATAAVEAAMAARGASALKLGLDCAMEVAHDFGAQPLCVLPVTLHVRNCCCDAALALSLSTLASPETGEDPPDDEADANARALGHAGGRCRWLGKTRLRRLWLAPGAHTQLRLSVGVSAAGLHVLRGLCVRICALRQSEGQPQLLATPVAFESPLTPVKVVDIGAAQLAHSADD